MLAKHRKILIVAWLVSAACLVTYVAVKRAGFEGRFPDRPFDSHAWHLIQHQNRVLLMKPWVLVPYLVLVASAIVFLLGPEVKEADPELRKWGLTALFVSLAIVAYLVVVVR